MKITDLKREHFKNGASFNQADFDAYITASDKYAKTFSVKYLSCVAGGILLSFLFSSAGGFAGNMLAVAAIFAGLILGAAINAPALKAVNSAAKKLGITKADVKQACEHVKNETVAWSGDKASDDAHIMCAQPTNKQVCSESSLPPRPARAVWMAALLLVAWITLLLFQFSLGTGLAFSGMAYVLLAAGLLGTAICLTAQSGLKWRLWGGAAGGIAAVQLAVSNWAIQAAKMGLVKINQLFAFNNPKFMQILSVELVSVLLCFGAALLVSIVRKKKGRSATRLCGLLSAVLYLLVRLALQFWYVFGLRFPDQVLPILMVAATVYVVCIAADSLCNMKTTGVKLHGVGLVWAWLAVVGALGTIVAVLVTATSAASGRAIAGFTRPYAFQLIVGLSGLSGYILLLCQKRAGLWVILLGTGLLLAAQTVSAIGYLGTPNGVQMLAAALLGALNPLFAWLAVRAGTAEAAAASAAS